MMVPTQPEVPELPANFPAYNSDVQLVLSNEMPKNIKPGEQVLVVVDGVAYQIVNDDGTDIGSTTAANSNVSTAPPGSDLVFSPSKPAVSAPTSDNDSQVDCVVNRNGSAKHISHANLPAPKLIVLNRSASSVVDSERIQTNNSVVSPVGAAVTSSVDVTAGDNTCVSTSSVKRTVLVENDAEFEHLASNISENLPLGGQQKPGAEKPATFVGSFLGFVRGNSPLPRLKVQSRPVLRLPTPATTTPRTVIRVGLISPQALSTTAAATTSSKVSVVTSLKNILSPKVADPKPTKSTARTPKKKVAKVVSRVAASTEKISSKKSQVAAEENTNTMSLTANRQQRVLKRPRWSSDSDDDDGSDAGIPDYADTDGDDDDDDDDDPAWKPSKDESRHLDARSKVRMSQKPSSQTSPRASSAEHGSRKQKQVAGDAESSLSSPAGVKLPQILGNSSDAHAYKKGCFVVERRQLHKDGALCLWKHEGNRLLHKFLPEVESDGSVVHKPTSVYTSWLGDLREMYKAVDVEAIGGSQSKKEVVRLKDVYLLRPLDDSLEDDALMDPFNIYIQTLLSQALDSSFLEVLQVEQEEYYTGSLELIDGLLDVTKKTILAQIEWTDEFQDLMESFPSYALEQTTDDDPKLCQASKAGDKPADKILLLYGACYDRCFLTCVDEVSREEAERVAVCDHSLRLFTSYHALHHYKYLLYMECLEEVMYARQGGDRSDSDVLGECLQHRIWVQRLLRRLKDLVQKCIDEADDSAATTATT